MMGNPDSQQQRGQLELQAEHSGFEKQVQRKQIQQRANNGMP